MEGRLKGIPAGSVEIWKSDLGIPLGWRVVGDSHFGRVIQYQGDEQRQKDKAQKFMEHYSGTPRKASDLKLPTQEMAENFIKQMIYAELEFTAIVQYLTDHGIKNYGGTWEFTREQWNSFLEQFPEFYRKNYTTTRGTKVLSNHFVENPKKSARERAHNEIIVTLSAGAPAYILSTLFTELGKRNIELRGREFFITRNDWADIQRDHESVGLKDYCSIGKSTEVNVPPPAVIELPIGFQCIVSSGGFELPNLQSDWMHIAKVGHTEHLIRYKGEMQSPASLNFPPTDVNNTKLREQYAWMLDNGVICHSEIPRFTTEKWLEFLNIFGEKGTPELKEEPATIIPVTDPDYIRKHLKELLPNGDHDSLVNLTYIIKVMQSGKPTQPQAYELIDNKLLNSIKSGR